MTATLCHCKHLAGILQTFGGGEERNAGKRPEEGARRGASYHDRIFEEDHVAGGEGARGIHAAACSRHVANLEGCQVSRVERIFPHKILCQA